MRGFEADDRSLQAIADARVGATGLLRIVEARLDVADQRLEALPGLVVMKRQRVDLRSETMERNLEVLGVGHAPHHPSTRPAATGDLSGAAA